VTDDTITRVQDLLVASLDAWRLNGSVLREADGTLRLTVEDATLVVSRAAAPFRWTVNTDTRARFVTSIAGLLRTLRQMLDPEYQPNRLRIAPSRLMPP
jgi:hypothetical protein